MSGRGTTSKRDIIPWSSWSSTHVVVLSQVVEGTTTDQVLEMIHLT